MSWLLKQIAGAAGPYIVGALAALCLSLAGILWFERHVTIPGLESQLRVADANLVVANGQTAAANQQIDACRAQIDRQNSEIADMQRAAKAAEEAARRAAASVRPPARPPAEKTAEAVNAYLRSLRTTP
ncbi:MAG: hypothetical protein QJR02_07145 [Sinobacteraceae bacterium]|nr:hypothetical protein [Nevskiaceae bacterium]